MFKFFNTNSFLAYAMLPFVLVIYRMRLILSPHIGQAASDSDLYTPLWEATFGVLPEGSYGGVAIALVLTFLTAMIVNNTSNNFHFTTHQSHLSGMMFIVLSSGFVIGQGLHPVQVFAFLLTSALYRLMKGVRDVRLPYRFCFDAMMFISVGSLFWAKGVWFVPLVIISAGILQILNIRTLLCFIFGFVAPYAIAFAVYYTVGVSIETYESHLQCLMVPVAFYKTTILGKVFVSLYGLLILISILSAIRNLSMLKIIESRMNRIIVWLILFSTIFIVIPYFSFELQILVAAGGGIAVSVWLQRLRRAIWAEIITSSFALMTLYIQWNI